MAMNTNNPSTTFLSPKSCLLKLGSALVFIDGNTAPFQLNSRKNWQCCARVALSLSEPQHYPNLELTRELTNPKPETGHDDWVLLNIKWASVFIF